MVDDEVLQDTAHRRVVRVGDTVRRPLLPWSATVHRVLRHLEAVDFPYSPRVLGIDEEGREVLTFIAGDSGPAAWERVVDEAGLVAMARLLRDYHQAIQGYSPAPEPGHVICHGDFGPWNLVWRGTEPVGIIDWDYVWSQPRIHDVAYALEYVAPFRDDHECVRWLRYPGPPDRRRRLELFAEAYGLTSIDGLADQVIAQQELVLDRTRRLAAGGHQPQADWLADGTLDATAERVAWSRRNRHLFS